MLDVPRVAGGILTGDGFNQMRTRLCKITGFPQHLSPPLSETWCKQRQSCQRSHSVCSQALHRLPEKPGSSEYPAYWCMRVHRLICVCQTAITLLSHANTPLSVQQWTTALKCMYSHSSLMTKLDRSTNQTFLRGFSFIIIINWSIKIVSIESCRLVYGQDPILGAQPAVAYPTWLVWLWLQSSVRC